MELTLSDEKGNHTIPDWFFSVAFQYSILEVWLLLELSLLVKEIANNLTDIFMIEIMFESKLLDMKLSNGESKPYCRVDIQCTALIRM